jgi:hypothetical protein
MRLEAQSKNMDIRSERLLSISLALGFEGDSRNGDKLGSDCCILFNPFSEEVQVAPSEFLGDVAIGLAHARLAAGPPLGENDSHFFGDVLSRRHAQSCSRSRCVRLASSSSGVGTRTMLQAW